MDTASGLSVTVVTEPDLGDLAASMLAYSRFYGDDPAPEALAAMSRAFIAEGSGTQLVARTASGDVVGHATVLWSWDTTLGAPLAVMEDLYVGSPSRGLGTGRALLEACRELARDRGCLWLQWQTAPDNATAQRLYDSLGGDRTQWFTYRVPTGGPSA